LSGMRFAVELRCLNPIVDSKKEPATTVGRPVGGCRSLNVDRT